MKHKLLVIFIIFIALKGFSKSKQEIIPGESSGKIQVIDQSEKYSIVDNIFMLEKQFGDSATIRLKTTETLLIDSGKYIIKINFYARWGIYVNEGLLKKTIEIEPNKTTKVYLVGGDYSGIYATDPKIEVDE